ncbi:F-box family protein [Prunus dulcis]|uniref:F-box family protein n=1 Tax=Prunus dulcis TaxID=3755 RepID=A0A4Y1R542_PRUDU|nr:F-box family protein [Prunus dulcis]
MKVVFLLGTLASHDPGKAKEEDPPTFVNIRPTVASKSSIVEGGGGLHYHYQKMSVVSDKRLRRGSPPWSDLPYDILCCIMGHLCFVAKFNFVLFARILDWLLKTRIHRSYEALQALLKLVLIIASNQ